MVNHEMVSSKRMERGLILMGGVFFLPCGSIGKFAVDYAEMSENLQGRLSRKVLGELGLPPSCLTFKDAVMRYRMSIDFFARLIRLIGLPVLTASSL
jgi:hypothetical protein